MARIVRLQCWQVEEAGAHPTGRGATPTPARSQPRRRPAPGVARPRPRLATAFAASVLVALGLFQPERCWQSAPLGRAEAEEGGAARRPPPRRAAVIAATSGAIPSLGAAGGAWAEEAAATKQEAQAEKQEAQEEPPPDLSANDTDFTAKRLSNMEPDDLKREMPDEEYFGAVMKLTALQRSYALEGRDEKPKTGKTVNGYKWDSKEQGVYVSAISGVDLFSSAARYDSQDGQLSFWAPIDSKKVIERYDVQDRLKKPEGEWRIQVVDRVSKTHLGHLYSDGPEPSRKRYKINAGVLRFRPGPAPAGDAAQALAGWKFN